MRVAPLRLSVRFLALLLLVFVGGGKDLPTVDAALDPTYLHTHNHTCATTGLPPREPEGLHFCTQYSTRSCCLPSFDLNSIAEDFNQIVPMGPGCGIYRHSAKAAYAFIQRLTCLPCDPQEPSYRFLTKLGDQDLGGVVPPVAGAADDDFTWRICRSFLYGRDHGVSRRGLWGSNASHFDKCGLNVKKCAVAPRLDATTGTFVAVDPTCTDESFDMVVPSVWFAEAEEPAESLLQYVPVQLPGFKFVVVNDESAAFRFQATPCFGKDRSASSRALVSVTALVILFLSQLWLGQ